MCCIFVGVSQYVCMQRCLNVCMFGYVRASEPRYIRYIVSFSYCSLWDANVRVCASYSSPLQTENLHFHAFAFNIGARVFGKYLNGATNVVDRRIKGARKRARKF